MKIFVIVCIQFLASVTWGVIAPIKDSSQVPDSIVSGKATYRRLCKTAFDSRQELRIRWKALMSIAAIGREESLPELERAALSPDWFMRDASLQAMAKLNHPAALKWSRKLISDPSLIVRTSAVRIMKDRRDISSSNLLWESLYASQNFRGNQSLWVRRHIVEALAALHPAKSEGKFVKLLEDRDTTLHAPAIKGLEGVTGLQLGLRDDNVAVKKTFWRRWAAQNPSRVILE